MFGIGLPELTVILVIVLVVFGAGKLPAIGGGLGKSIRNFKNAVAAPDGIDEEQERTTSSGTDRLHSAEEFRSGATANDP